MGHVALATGVAVRASGVVLGGDSWQELMHGVARLACEECSRGAGRAEGEFLGRGWALLREWVGSRAAGGAGAGGPGARLAGVVDLGQAPLLARCRLRMARLHQQSGDRERTFAALRQALNSLASLRRTADAAGQEAGAALSLAMALCAIEAKHGQGAESQSEQDREHAQLAAKAGAWLLHSASAVAVAGQAAWAAGLCLLRLQRLALEFGDVRTASSTHRQLVSVFAPVPTALRPAAALLDRLPAPPPTESVDGASGASSDDAGEGKESSSACWSMGQAAASLRALAAAGVAQHHRWVGAVRAIWAEWLQVDGWAGGLGPGYAPLGAKGHPQQLAFVLAKQGHTLLAGEEGHSWEEAVGLGPGHEADRDGGDATGRRRLARPAPSEARPGAAPTLALRPSVLFDAAAESAGAELGALAAAGLADLPHGGAQGRAGAAGQQQGSFEGLTRMARAAVERGQRQGLFDSAVAACTVAI